MSASPDDVSSDEGSFEDCQEEPDQGVEVLSQDLGNIQVADDFSLIKLNHHFSAALSCSGVSIAEYILGYREVFKFLTLLGKVFSFVAVDVKTKLDLLEKYNTGEQKEHYQTVKGMIQYEIEENLIKVKKKDDPSGSRTLLRLHRALEYVVAFLAKLDAIDYNDKCAPISREAYEATLMKHHIWAVQKAAKLAMALLPTKIGLVNKVCPEAEHNTELLKQVESDFQTAIDTMRKVYDETQELYSVNDLLDIP